MVCGKCNTPIPEGGVYCPKCGSRADGKKQCPNCKNYTDGDFCTYCGCRLDGKTLCPTCNNYYDGNFCPFCGTGSQKINERSSDATGNKKIKEGSGYATATKTLSGLVSPILLLCVVAVLFICSFFIGISVTVDLGLASATEQSDTFYFFGEVYDDLKAIKTEITGYYSESSVPQNIVTAYNTAYVFPAILTTVILGLNLIASFTCLVLAVVCSIKKFCKKETPSILIYAIISFACFLFSVATVYTAMSVGADTSSVNGDVGLSSGSLAGLILGLILISLAITIKQLELGKRVANPKNLCKLISYPVIIGLSVTVALLVSKYYAVAKTSLGEANMSSIVYYQAYGLMLADSFKDFPTASFILSLLSQLLVFGSASTLAYLSILGLCKNGKKSLSIGLIICGALLLVGSTTYFGVGGYFLNEVDELLIRDPSFSKFIVILILSVILVATVILSAVFTRNKKNQTLNGNN